MRKRTNALASRWRVDRLTDLALARRSEIRIICTSPLPYCVARLRLIKLDRILSAESELQPLVAKTRDLRAAAGLVNGFLPAELARETRVANIRDGHLTLIAANSAAAAKIKLPCSALRRLLLHRH